MCTSQVVACAVYVIGALAVPIVIGAWRRFETWDLLGDGLLVVLLSLLWPILAAFLVLALVLAGPLIPLAALCLGLLKLGAVGANMAERIKERMKGRKDSERSGRHD